MVDGNRSSVPRVASALAVPKSLNRETERIMSGVPSYRPWETNIVFSKRVFEKFPIKIQTFNFS